MLLQEANLLPILQLEDVSMSIWVQMAKSIHLLPVKVMSHPGIMYLDNTCEDNALVVHYMKPAAQLCAWESAQQLWLWRKPVCSCRDVS